MRTLTAICLLVLTACAPVGPTENEKTGGRYSNVYEVTASNGAVCVIVESRIDSSGVGIACVSQR